jgi:hypothetical protein
MAYPWVMRIKMASSTTTSPTRQNRAPRLLDPSLLLGITGSTL